MELQFIRHATQILTYAGKCILVDPMFSVSGKFVSLTLGASYGRNPRIPLPVRPETLSNVDAILVTHTHFDHWDQAARRLLPKHLPVLCQPADAGKLKQQGFLSVYAVPRDSQIELLGIKAQSFPGRHGRGIIGRLMGPSSGFCLQAGKEPALCLSGDTVWCPEFERALAKHQPRVVVLYAGEARFNIGGPITLGAADIGRVARALPLARIVAVHLNSINHCRETRAALAQALAPEPWLNRVALPREGETIIFT